MPAAIIDASTGLAYLAIVSLVVAAGAYGLVLLTERWVGRWATVTILILAAFVILSATYHLVAAPIIWDRYGECVGIWMEIPAPPGRESICISPR